MASLWLVAVDRRGQLLPSAVFSGSGWSSSVVYGDWRAICGVDDVYEFRDPEGGMFIVGWGGQREGYWLVWRVVAQMCLKDNVEPRVYDWDELDLESRAMYELLRSTYVDCDLLLVTFTMDEVSDDAMLGHG